MTREKVIEGLEYLITAYAFHGEDDECLGEAVELLKEQEQKCGKWERITGMAPPEYHGHRICSICECFAPYDPLHMGREILPKYCPGCGAKMEGEVG